MVTLELRWFVPEALDDRALRVFAERSAVEDRADVYQLGLSDEHGLKRRGRAGLLEHKRRVAQIPVHLPLAGGRLDGVIERWRKYWPDPDGLAPEIVPEHGDRWARVAKRRAIRTIGACRAELTALTGPGLAAAYHSVAIEAARDDAVDELLAAAGNLFAREPELAARLLVDAESCGYPAWLARHWR